MLLRPALAFGTAIVSMAALAESPADRWNLAEIHPSVAAWNAVDEAAPDDGAGAHAL